MNAIEFLIKEHNKVRTMFEEIEGSSKGFESKLDLFNTMCDDLLRHETMEHKIWYPHFKNDSRLKDDVKHLLREENDAEKAIKKLNDIEDEKAWEQQFAQFKKEVQHHANEEEEKLFPEVKQILDEAKLLKIGKEMKEFKEEYKEPSI